MPEQTIADLRARLGRDSIGLPDDHPIWGLLDSLGGHHVIPPEFPGLPTPFIPTVSEARDAILWLLGDLVNAAELSAKAHVSILQQELDLQSWKTCAVVLSETLARIVRDGKVSLTGDPGEVRRAVIKRVALHANRDDVLGVQPEDKRTLRPFEAQRGTRAWTDAPVAAEEVPGL